jgi:hypothetical protein
MTKDKTTTLSQENVRQVADAARQWVTSTEGQNAVMKGLEQAQTMTAQFREAQRIDPSILHKPVTF